MINEIISPKGHHVSMMTSHPLHYGNEMKIEREKDDVSTSFSDMLNTALGKVNDQQIESENLVQQMIYAPETVDIHQVMIAAQKAEIAMQFTKSVRDEAVRAYRELINLR